MDRDTIVRMQQDPAVFRQHLLIDTDQGPRALANAMANDPWQWQDFLALDPGWRRVAGQNVAGGYSRGYLERGRGHSKTSDQAVMATWALFASRRQLAGVAAAADKDQAGLLRDAIARLVSLNAWLATFLDVQRDRVVNIHTGSTLTILSSDAPTSYGLTPDFIVIDELTHWGERRDLWDSLLSAAAKRSHCMIAIISNAGFGAGTSWQWALREAVQEDTRWYFHRLDGPVASWITQDRLDEQQRLLPALAYDRLWNNRWTTGSGDAIRPDDLAAAFDGSEPLPAGAPGWVFFAGLDIGLSRDASALVVVGRHVGHTERRYIDRPPRHELPIAKILRDIGEWPPLPYLPDHEDVPHPATWRLRLAEVHAWKPERGERVSLEAVEARILDVHSRYRLSGLAADPWQAEMLIQRLQRQRVPIEGVPFTPSSLAAMATSTIEAFTDRNISLFDHPELRAELDKCKVIESKSGIRLAFDRNAQGHGDRATALALALSIAKRAMRPSGPVTLDRPIGGYPGPMDTVPWEPAADTNEWWR
jgi:phage terminase large subunit-like protein